MTPKSYALAWMVYLSSGISLYIVGWFLTSKLRSLMLRRLLRVSAAVVLFTPYFSAPEQNWLAPAILVTIFEAIFGDIHFALHAGAPLLVIWIALAATSLVVTQYQLRYPATIVDNSTEHNSTEHNNTEQNNTGHNNEAT